MLTKNKNSNFSAKSTLFVLLLVVLLLAFSFGTCASELSSEFTDENALQRQADELNGYFSVSSLFDAFVAGIKNAFSPTAKNLFGIISLLLLCAVARSFSFPFSDGICAHVGVLCISGYTFSILKGLCSALTSYASVLKDITATLLPTLVFACAADGAATAKASYGGMTAAMLVIELLVERLILPCVKMLTVLSLSRALCERTVNLSGISSSLRTFCVFSVTLAMTAVVTVLHFQHVIAKATDSIGLRAVRFASVSLIPIVGGLVGESIKTVTEALRSVRGITGAAGAAAVLSAFLPPVCAVLIYKAETVFCTCLAKTLGLEKESGLLSETGGILNLLSAAMLACTISFSAVICIISDAI